MKEIYYAYWKMNYISCEGNTRWFVVKTLEDIDEVDLIDELLKDGGCDDDPAEYLSHEVYFDDDTAYDWTHIKPY